MDAVIITPFPTLDDGIEFRFRGVERDADGNPIGEMLTITLIVPPLNLDSLKREETRIQAISADANVESMTAIVDITARALSQNYSGVPRWLIEQSINVGNVTDFIRSFMDMNGLKRKEIEAGKALAAKVSIGTDSTAT